MERKKRSKGSGWECCYAKCFFRDVWSRNESVRAEIGQILHTDTRGKISSRDTHEFTQSVGRSTFAMMPCWMRVSGSSLSGSRSATGTRRGECTTGGTVNSSVVCYSPSKHPIPSNTSAYSFNMYACAVSSPFGRVV